jgi:hypothetical protein
MGQSIREHQKLPTHTAVAKHHFHWQEKKVNNLVPESNKAAKGT